MNKIKLYRLLNEMTQKELAEKTGLTQGYITALETGRTTGTVKSMLRIAKVLNVKIDDLIKGE